MRVPSFYLLLLGYGSLAAAVMACLWLISLAPLRLGWGRELVGAAIAIVAMSVGLQLARRRADAPRPAALRGSSGPSGSSDSPSLDAPEPPALTAEAVPIMPTVNGSPSAAELSLREREVLQRLAE